MNKYKFIVTIAVTALCIIIIVAGAVLISKKLSTTKTTENYKTHSSNAPAFVPVSSEEVSINTASKNETTVSSGDYTDTLTEDTFEETADGYIYNEVKSDTNSDEAKALIDYMLSIGITVTECKDITVSSMSDNNPLYFVDYPDADAIYELSTNKGRIHVFSIDGNFTIKEENSESSESSGE